jgi:class 3 adenylate cyclase/CheY-like chemotaxis protein
MRPESRTATVLFTDIVASTALMSRLGDGATRVRSRHFAALRNALAMHDGVEVKTLGDGIMAVFASTHHAIECAVAMQQDVAARDAQQPDAAFEQRVGLSVGDVLHNGGDYFGTAVVEASRLCAAAAPGEILLTDVVHALVAADCPHPMQCRGPLVLKGLGAPRVAWALQTTEQGRAALRVALAEDSLLLREGMASVLEAEGFEVVLQARDADTLLAGIPKTRPHVAILDVRMPPTYTTEGLRAALWIRSEYPEIGVLMLSQVVTAGMGRRLLEGGTHRVGYLLKDRVADIDELVAAIRTVASGGRAIESSILAALTDDEVVLVPNDR